MVSISRHSVTQIASGGNCSSVIPILLKVSYQPNQPRLEIDREACHRFATRSRQQNPIRPLRSNHLHYLRSRIIRRVQTMCQSSSFSVGLRQTQEVHTTTAHCLGSSSATKLCSRLLERYDQINYFSINDAANIDEENRIGLPRSSHRSMLTSRCRLDLKKMEHRYECIQRAVVECRSKTRGFLIAGEVEEKNFCKEWLTKVRDYSFSICSMSCSMIDLARSHWPCNSPLIRATTDNQSQSPLRTGNKIHRQDLHSTSNAFRSMRTATSKRFSPMLFVPWTQSSRKMYLSIQSTV